MKPKDFEKIFKSLANRRRIAVLIHIKRNREVNVGAIAKELRLSLPATSRHLNLLEKAGILEKDQRDKEVFYRLATPQHQFIQEFFDALSDK
jgi:DNA-binding transcriptional ArsR family regulator